MNGLVFLQEFAEGLPLQLFFLITMVLILLVHKSYVFVNDPLLELVVGAVPSHVRQQGIDFAIVFLNRIFQLFFEFLLLGLDPFQLVEGPLFACFYFVNRGCEALVSFFNGFQVSLKFLNTFFFFLFYLEILVQKVLWYGFIHFLQFLSINLLPKSLFSFTAPQSPPSGCHAKWDSWSPNCVIWSAPCLAILPSRTPRVWITEYCWIATSQFDRISNAARPPASWPCSKRLGFFLWPLEDWACFLYVISSHFRAVDTTRQWTFYIYRCRPFQ